MGNLTEFGLCNSKTHKFINILNIKIKILINLNALVNTKMAIFGGP